MIDFNENMKLVNLTFRKHFLKFNYLKDDLFQEGFIALWNCCKFYNDNIKAKFETYASKSIYNSMLKTILKEKTNNENCLILSELENFDLPDNETFNDHLNLLFIKQSIEIPDKRNSKIIKSCIFNKSNQSKVAKYFKLSRQRVSQIVCKYKNDLKEDLQ